MQVCVAGVADACTTAVHDALPTGGENAEPLTPTVYEPATTFADVALTLTVSVCVIGAVMLTSCDCPAALIVSVPAVPPAPDTPVVVTEPVAQPLRPVLCVNTPVPEWPSTVPLPLPENVNRKPTLTPRSEMPSASVTQAVTLVVVLPAIVSGVTTSVAGATPG